MKINKLSIITALLMTVAIAAIVFAFDYANKKQNHGIDVNILFAVSILLIFIITYIGIEILFSKYGKKEIRKMAEKFPDEIFDVNEKNIGFKEFSEKITKIRQKDESQLDMMSRWKIIGKNTSGISLTN